MKKVKGLHVLRKMRPSLFSWGQWRTSHPLSFILLACLASKEIWVCDLLDGLRRDVFFKVILPDFGPIFVHMKIYWTLNACTIQNLAGISLPRSTLEAKDHFLSLALAQLFSSVDGSSFSRLSSFPSVFLYKHSESGFKHKLWERVSLWMPQSSFYSELDPSLCCSVDGSSEMYPCQQKIYNLMNE